MNLLETLKTKEETMETFKGYRIKGIDIDRLPELTEELTEKPQYSIYLLLEPIEGVPDDSVEISSTPSQIWKESFTSVYPEKLRTLTNQVRYRQQGIYMSLGIDTTNEFCISVQGFNIATIAQHSQFFIDLVDSVNKQALSEIEKKVQEKQKKEKANEDFRKKAEQINAECFPATPASE